MILNNTRSYLSPRPRGRAVGWGVSLLAHALLVAWVLGSQPPRPAPGPEPARITFVLLPRSAPAQVPAQVPVQVPVRPAAPPAAHAPDVPAPRHASAPGAVAHAVAPAPITQVPAPASAVIVAPDPAAAPSTTPGTPDASNQPAVPAPAPGFDMAAARDTARLAAREHGDGNLVARTRPPPTLDPGREAHEEKLSRDIERSTRHDCRTAYAGAGLLAVIPLLKDAVTGSGCKW